MAPNLKAPCRKCGNIPDPAPYRYTRGDYLCNPCFNAYYRSKGYKGGDCSPEWWKAYNKKYHSRPDVLKRKAEHAKSRYKNPTQRLKILARNASREAMKKGKIPKMPCKQCGSMNSQIHHADYNQRFKVEWYCRPCHTDLHKAKAKEGRK